MRPINAADRAFFIDLHQDELTCQYVGGPMSTSKAVADFDFSLRLNRVGSLLTFIIINKNSNQPLGICALVWSKTQSAVEMGIYLQHQQFSQGIATEVLPQLLTFAFEQLAITSIMIRTHAENVAMIKVIQGFKQPLKKVAGEYCWFIANNTL